MQLIHIASIVSIHRVRETSRPWKLETLRLWEFVLTQLCSSILCSSAPRRRLHILPHWSLHLLLHCSTQNLYFAVIHSCTVAAHLHTCSVAQRRAFFHIEARTGFSRIFAAQYGMWQCTSDKAQNWKIAFKPAKDTFVLCKLSYIARWHKHIAR